MTEPNKIMTFTAEIYIPESAVDGKPPHTLRLTIPFVNEIVDRPATRKFILDELEALLDLNLCAFDQIDPERANAQTRWELLTGKTPTGDQT